MQPVRSLHPAGFVGVISGDLARYAQFTVSMLKLQVPPDTLWNYVRGNGIASNRNELLKACFESQANCAWVWFIDDDHDFHPGTLIRLLGVATAGGWDILQPIVSTRKPPYRPYAYRLNEATGEYVTLRWTDLLPGIVNTVDAVGTGGMLIQRRVFEAIGDPWFKEGKTHPGAIGEDLWFCTEARQHGFRVGVDCTTPIGHLSCHSVRPQCDADGNWSVALDLEHGLVVSLEAEAADPTVSVPAKRD